MKDTNAEDVATWLARETGHVPEADEGYEDDGGYDKEKGIGLPQAKHEKMRRFFDGLAVEKAMTEKRRAGALDAVDEAEQMNQALKGSIPPVEGY